MFKFVILLGTCFSQKLFGNCNRRTTFQYYLVKFLILSSIWRIFNQNIKILNQFFHRITNFISYFFKAETIYGIDSPVLYEFFQTVLDDRRVFYAFSDIDHLRNELKKNTTRIKKTDFGTGINHSVTTVSDVVKTSSITKFKGELLFRLVNWFKPNNIIELGTNLGLSAAYMASACRDTTLISIEGDKSLAYLASNNIKQLELSNVNIVLGTFEKELSQILLNQPGTELFYIDGNHNKNSTIEYTKKIIQNCKNKYLLIFDDIYWSKDMSDAWLEIQEFKEFNFVIDLYFWGLAGKLPSLKAPIRKVLIPTRYKFWKAGFFR